MLSDKLQSDLILALKAGESLRVSVLRMLLSEINYKKIAVQRDLTDTDIVDVIQKEVKKRREAIESYNQAGRTEQANTEKQEMEILQAYLPKQMNEKDLRIEIEKEINKLDEATKSNFGQVMKVVLPLFKGKADGALVAAIVREYVSG